MSMLESANKFYSFSSLTQRIDQQRSHKMIYYFCHAENRYTADEAKKFHVILITILQWEAGYGDELWSWVVEKESQISERRLSKMIAVQLSTIETEFSFETNNFLIS